MGRHMHDVLILFLIYIIYSATSEDSLNEDYQLSGFINHESVPVSFPKDICIFRVDDVKFAASLHFRSDGPLQFVLFKQKNGNFVDVFSRITPNAVDMDCISMGSKAYIALAFRIEETVENITNGSPVFEVTKDDISVMQFFVDKYQSAIYLRKHGSRLFLIQAHLNQSTEDESSCPIYELTDYHFNYKDEIPCKNAKYIEPFIVDGTVYAMVSNAYAEEEMYTTSILYKYRFDLQQFMHHQTFKAGGMGQIKYFEIENSQQGKEHFIVLAGPANRDEKAIKEDVGDPSVIYRFSNGIFEPIQQIYFHNVTQFLPVNRLATKFLLLVSCKNQDIQFIRYNGRRFERSNVPLTGGSLSKGVATMRTFDDFNATYIVIANERMEMNETNVYLPFYKTRRSHKYLRQDLLDRFHYLQEKLTNRTEKMKRIENIAGRIGQGIGIFNDANIQHVDAKLMYNPKYNLTENKWKKIENATQSLLKLEQVIQSINHTNVQNQSDGSGIFESLHLETLAVTDILEVTTAININSRNHSFEKIYADKIIVKGNSEIKNFTEHSLQPLNDASSNNTSQFENVLQGIQAKQIIVSGTFNGLNFSEFQNQILKKHGDQVITALYRFENLNTTNFQVNGTINGESLSKIITVNGDSFVVDQDLIFTQPLTVNNLVINDRLNHINVVQGRLDVLLKDSEEIQTINAKKIFENVRLLEPFTLQAKIHSPRLEAINPVVVITDPLSLEGNYEIFGNVLVTNRIAGRNFFGEKTKRNLLEVVENGLSANTSVIHQSMEFKEPIITNNAKATFLNDVDILDFVVDEKNTEQMITAKKTFKNDVHLNRGFCPIENINQVNLKDLSETRLRKYGDQNVTGILQFREIRATQITTSTAMTLNNTNIIDILTSSTPQRLNEVIVNTLKVDKINATKIEASKKVFNQNLDFIINDTVLAGQTVQIKGVKTFIGNFTTQDLTINKHINGQDAQQLMDSFMRLEDDIVIEDNIEFSMDMELDSLTFEGKINGLTSNKFGTSWLLTEGLQNFTAPQIFDEIQGKDIYISGKLNNRNIDKIITNIYWLDRDENIPNLSFEKIVAENDFNVGGHINDMKFASRVLLSKSEDIQTIEAPVTCEGNIITTGQVKELRIFNNIDFANLHAIFNGHSFPAKLTVDSAVFEKHPQFRYLNNNNLSEIMENAWFIHRDVEIVHPMWFADVESKTFIQTNGLVNDISLKYLDEYYLSLSKTQRINSPTVFKQPVTFEEALSSERMTLKGFLVDTESGQTLNITDMAINCLRNDVVQEIKGQWSFSTVYLEGNLNDATINGLRIVDDVLRYDIQSLQNITAPKWFTNVSTVDLDHSPQASINDIDLIDWMKYSVLSNGNYTIHGKTTIDELMLYDDLNVFGKVNGIKFDEKHLLLVDTDQIVHGNVTIRTKFEKKKKIIPFSIKYLNVTAINDVHIDKFFESIVPKDEDITIKGNLVFEATPIVKHFRSNHDIFEMNGLRKNTTQYVQRLQDEYETLEKSFQVRSAFLSHYELKLSTSGDIQKVLYLRSASIDDQSEDLIAVLRGENELSITFHSWSKEKDSFDLDTNLFEWKSEGNTIIDCDKIYVMDIDLLLVETFNQSVYSKYFLSITNDGLQVNLVVHSDQSVQVTPTIFKGQQCFIMYTSYYSELAMHCIKPRPSDGKDELLVEMTIDIGDVVLEVAALQESSFIVSTPQGIRFYDLQPQIPSIFVAPVELTPDFFIYVLNPISITVDTYDDHYYLAVSSSGRNVEIFRSSNASTFSHIQTIEVHNVMQLKFSTITSSQDFLLYVSTTDQKEPLIGYFYKGVVGFKKFFRPINLKPAKRFDLITLQAHNKHFVSYETTHHVSFLEAIVLHV